MNRSAIDIEQLLGDPMCFAREAECPIGYVGLDIPEDVLAAPSLVAVHLPWEHGRKTPSADRWLEESFPGWARSILEDWLGGRFDFMECVVFTRGDDTSQRLYYYLCELQRRGTVAGPRPHIFDVAKIPRPSSATWTSNAVRRLAADLHLDDENLNAGIRVANRRREILCDADRNRRLPGYFCEQLARASLFAPVERLSIPGALAESAQRPRVLLAGSSPPDDSLHRAVESSGWSVVGELYERNLTRLGPPVDEHAGEPADRIGAGISANQTGARSFADRTAKVLREVEKRNADAVIYWLHEQDEAIAWDVVRSSRALQERAIATLVMPRRQWDLSDAPDADVANFLGSLNK